MSKPRIFLGSSGKQAKLLQAITRGLEDVADVEPWTTTFNPGRSTLDRLVELSQEVDFAAFVFARSSFACLPDDPKKIRGLFMGDSMMTDQDPDFCGEWSGSCSILKGIFTLAADPGPRLGSCARLRARSPARTSPYWGNGRSGRTTDRRARGFRIRAHARSVEAGDGL